jgi:hypothetical protein
MCSGGFVRSDGSGGFWCVLAGSGECSASSWCVLVGFMGSRASWWILVPSGDLAVHPGVFWWVLLVSGFWCILASSGVLWLFLVPSGGFLLVLVHLGGLCCVLAVSGYSGVF